MSCWDTLHKLFVVLTIIFFIVALAIPYWSVADVTFGTDPGEKGKVFIGLWKACSNLDANKVFARDYDCRLGHCTSYGTLCSTSAACSLDSHELCERSKVSASFLLVSLFFMVVIFYCTVWKSFRKLPENLGLAQISYVICLFSGLICWAVWAHWNQLVSDDSDRSVGPVTTFGQFTLNGAFGIVVVSWLFQVYGFIYCYRMRKSAFEQDYKSENVATQRPSEMPLADMAESATDA